MDRDREIIKSGTSQKHRQNTRLESRKLLISINSDDN